jgi:uncharacterized protein (TIGR03437 family)
VNSAGDYIFTIQLGGATNGNIVLLDADGNIFVGGQAGSLSFLTTPGTYRTSAPQATTFGDYSANFACKLRPTDGTPMYCTFLDDTAALLMLDTAGDLFFTKSVPGSSNSYSIVKLGPTGAKSLESVPIDGTVYVMTPNADGTLYLSGQTQSPQFPFSSAPAVPPSPAHPAVYYGKFDPQTGFLFAQNFGAHASFKIALRPSVGPVLAGDLGSGFSVRQYASDGTTIVYDRSLPLVTYGNVYVVDEGIVLSGYSSSAALPLYHNLHVCSGISGTDTTGMPLLIRLDQSGAVVQSTWLGSAFNLVHTTDGGWSALGSTLSNEEVRAFFPNAYVQVLNVGPNPMAQPMPIGCMTDLAQGTTSVASPGLLVSLSIEDNVSGEPVIAQPDSSGRFPTSLAGMAITFDGVPAPLFALNGQQLSAAVPFSVDGKSTVQMCWTSLLAVESCLAIQVRRFGPAVFSKTGVMNQDGTVNSAEHPAPPGSIMTFYLIGLGPLSPDVPDGMIVGTPLPELANQVSVLFATSLAGGFPGPGPTPPAESLVTYAGPAPFEVAGVYQINARVPSGVFGKVTIIVGQINVNAAGTVINVSLSKTP